MKITLLLLSVLAGLGALGAPAPPAWPDAKDPLAGMGVDIHFTDPPPGELEMLAHAGFRWVRMDLTWAATERTPGVYDFSHVDTLLAHLDPLHLRAMLILCYANPLYDGGKPTCSDVGRAAFARWAVAAVNHFKNRGVLWEIWNEPNGDWFWKPKANAGDYAKLALTVSKAIHDAAPNEPIVGPALSGTNLDFLKVVAKTGVVPYWSGVTIHPYLRGGPESYGPVYQQVRDLIEKNKTPGQQIDVMCGESGYATTWTGIDDTTQGKYLARLFLFDVMDGVPLTMWYDWCDDGMEPHNQEHHFGIVHHEYHAGAADVHDSKPAYHAAMTYAQQLAGFRYQDRIPAESPNDYLLTFTRGATGCVVAWTSASAPHEVTFSQPSGVYQVTGYDGQPKPDLSASDGHLKITLDQGPQYIRLR